jgi:hypothetical protein
MSGTRKMRQAHGKTPERHETARRGVDVQQRVNVVNNFGHCDCSSKEQEEASMSMIRRHTQQWKMMWKTASIGGAGREKHGRTAVSRPIETPWQFA